MKQESYLFYGDENESYISASEAFAEIKKFLPEINSVVDIGCGMAAFSKIFQENGVKEITLVDHPSINIEKCLVKEGYHFVPCDFDKHHPPKITSDLVICTEVLEHINLKRSVELFDYIISCADIFIFSAAIPKQGGTGHINERYHDLWIRKFREKGYDYADLFKANIIKNEKNFFFKVKPVCFFQEPSRKFSLNKRKMDGKDFAVVKVSILKNEYGFMKLFKMLPRAFKSSIAFWYHHLTARE